MADAILTGVFTNKGRELLAKDFGNVGTGVTTRAFYFKYGEGGFITTGGGRVPKSPEDGVALLDLEAEADASLFSFQKSLVTTDFTFIAPSIMQVRCRLAEAESNDNGMGESPRFFEIGIFDDDDNMLIWATFSEQTKTASKILNNLVQVVF